MRLSPPSRQAIRIREDGIAPRLMDSVSAAAGDPLLAAHLGALARTEYVLVLGVDGEGRVVYASPGIGTTIGDPSGHDASLFDLVHAGDRSDARSLLERAGTADAPARATLRFRNAAGQSWREMNVVAVPASDDRSTIVLGLHDRSAVEPLRRRIERNERRLRRLTARLHAAQEEERRRLAGEVHDVLGQALTALRMDICWMKEHAVDAAPPFVERLDDALALTETTIDNVRTMSHELRPAVLDHFGLAAALEWQSDEYDDRFDLSVRFRNGIDVDVDVPDALAVALFRIFQESFTNVIRHAGADVVTVSLDRADGGDGIPALRLVVEDDGRGFDPDALERDDANGSLGILNMRERVMPFGGTLEVDGRPGHGTTVTVVVPLLPAPGGGPS